ncbi:MAG: SxtJ family membrane protein [Ignavibacteriaceae bacterium]|nr:SxtJ family membrane protein [Ignavibacteriaceae bacterium]
MIAEEIKQIKATPAELRKFGLTIGGLLSVIGIILIILHAKNKLIFSGLGFLIMFLGLTLPKALTWVYKLWMGLSVVLGFISTRIILSILFYFVLTPIKFLYKFTGKNFLDLKIEKSAASYWRKRPVITFDKSQYEKQF